jgi:nucleoside-diphosphate-sugar epimerase
MRKVLVTGATGQIGSELTMVLRQQLGAKNVVAVGHSRQPDLQLLQSGVYRTLDIRDQVAVQNVVIEHQVDTIFHLASLLSVVAEQQPQKAWDINMQGLMNVLEVARMNHCAVFFPSSIGAFGLQTPAMNTPQDTIQRPDTMYGVTKVAGELLCDYYHKRYAVEVRGLRYPGLISFKTQAGGGVTDYAVEIFYAALQQQAYCCFLRADTQLDMMYMPDAVNAAIRLMQADINQLTHHNAFNITAISITPEQLAAEIKRHIPEFKMSYKIDPARQAIADSWPRHMDDSCARKEWGWRHEYSLSVMVKDMLVKLADKLSGDDYVTGASRNPVF